MITVLFDIDGTLIRSGGAGLKAIEQAMQEMFGIDSISKVKVHGRTDNGILSDLFAAESLSFDNHREEFSRRYWELLPEALQCGKGKSLPGVRTLLERISKLDHVATGILTGNAQRAAEIKLRHFELDGYFKFGGYGDLYSCRNEVAALARAAAEQHLNEQFDSNKLWVVGDTVNDIKCARSIGSRVIAVETGGCAPEELDQEKPDYQFADLSNVEPFLEAIEGLG